ncbi:hypothetical protein [Hydrocarboniphaga sp.]|uniref:hypothetical protein n=1 Tax=Hydrocarboniphaga sp. TaxID=2033016 RepID=UPI003D0CA61E
MLELAVSERAYLAHRRALTTNAEGQEILLGLTHQESLAYIDCCRHGGDRTAQATMQWNALRDRHEAARDVVIDIEEMLVCRQLHRNGTSPSSAYL